MDEIVVRLARTLACYERLRILFLLVEEGELTATAVGQRLNIAKNALSAHLAKLATVGLIKRRRSAGWSYCSAGSVYGAMTLSGMASAAMGEWLVNAKRTLKHCGVHELRKPSSRDAPHRLHEIIFEAATAFTDLRRLQILRHLVQHGGATAESLRSSLRMSPWAVMRHVDKLVRRGYIVKAERDAATAFHLAREFKTPIHERLWLMVRGTWQESGLRSS